MDSSHHPINSSLWEKSNWLNKTIDYLFGVDLVEWDMKSAGLSLIKEFQLLPEKKIELLENKEKIARNIDIGLIQRSDREFAKKLLEGFKEARKRFVESNQLSEEVIVSIKKDAFFLFNREVEQTTFGNIHFVKKNSYTSYLRLNKLEFYLNTEENRVDIKGLGQDTDFMKTHGEYLLKFMLTFCRMRERFTDKKIVVRWLTKFVSDYRQKKLPIGYYRLLRAENAYEYYDEQMGENIFVMDTDEIEKVSIHYNYYNFILPLVRLYL